MMQIRDNVGVVVIGRNEGERLRRCLQLLAEQGAMVVYVDSGSTDDSVSLARGMGADVVELEMATPFTAARARNAGFRRLRELAPGVEFAAFFDGDCAVATDWLAAGRRVLLSRPDVAVVCGRLRELAPHATIYNRLCDIEWDGAVGEIAACGGNAMMRAKAFEAAGGFDEALIAGEEPELCARLRTAGWRVLRIDAPMAQHDAAMHRFGQWWRRAARSGHAVAEGVWFRGRTTQRDLNRRLASILGWAVLLPMIALVLAWPSGGWSLVALAAAFTLLAARIYIGQRRRGRPPSHASLYAGFIILGKFAEATGVFRFLFAKLLRRRCGIIEYKASPFPPDPVSSIR